MKILSQSSHQAHVFYNNKYYVVSDNGFETLVFPADKRGSITNYVEVGGGRGYTVAEVLSNFHALTQW